MKKRIITSLFALATLACQASDPTVYPLRILSIDLIPVSCEDDQTIEAENGPTTATVDFDVTGGSFEYTFSIDGGDPQTDHEFTGVAPGQHNFTISDGDDTVTATIFVGPSAFTRVTVSQAPYCDDRFNLGVISVATQGGTPPLNQSLNGEEVDEDFEGAEGDFPPVAAERYTVVSSSNDGSGCQPIAIAFDLIIPQSSDNDILDFINEKYCIPCVD